MRVLFIGSTRRGFLAFRALLEASADVIGVISLRQHEHEVERYEERIAELARQRRVPLFESRWLKERDYAALLADELKPDVAFVVGCRILIPREIYEIPPAGMWAVHDSLLPNYRGFAPLNWAVLNGEKYTGVTLFRLNETMDGGDILAQIRVPIGPDDAAPEVFDRLCDATNAVVGRAVQDLEQGTARARPQDVSAGAVCCSRTPDDGMLEWDRSAARLYAQVRALAFPYPGAFTYHRGHRLIVWRARPVGDAPEYVGRIPGRVVGISSEDGSVDVLTGDGVLRLLDVQPEAAQRCRPAEVITSVRDGLGPRIPDLLARITALEARIAKLERDPDDHEIR